MCVTTRVSPFGHPRVVGRLHLFVAFRSLPRPSSPSATKASTVCPFFLDLTSLHIFICLMCLVLSFFVYFFLLSSFFLFSTNTYVHTFFFLLASLCLFFFSFLCTFQRTILPRFSLACFSLGLSKTDNRFHIFFACVFFLLRKEVIQAHLPVHLPCYDFTPLTKPTLNSCLSLKLAPTIFRYSRLGWCDGRCVQGPGTYSPQLADLRLLAIPASCRRVAACNLN